MKIKTSDYNYEPIGKRIKNVRLERKFTQEYVAEKLNVSCQHISDVERGLNGMSIPSLMQLCKVLDTDADYILFGTATRSKNNPFNKLIEKMTPEESMHAEEILMAYAKSCGIK